MKDKIAKLIDVKSIVTLLTTLAFVILCVLHRDIPQNFMTIYTVIISFYFGTQSQKYAREKENEKNEG